MASDRSEEFLASLLPEWYALLQGWALNGSLVAAAQEALLLDGTPEPLEELAAAFKVIQDADKQPRHIYNF